MTLLSHEMVILIDNCVRYKSFFFHRIRLHYYMEHERIPFVSQRIPRIIKWILCKLIYIRIAWVLSAQLADISTICC